MSKDLSFERVERSSFIEALFVVVILHNVRLLLCRSTFQALESLSSWFILTTLPGRVSMQTPCLGRSKVVSKL